MTEGANPVISKRGYNYCTVSVLITIGPHAMPYRRGLGSGPRFKDPKGLHPVPKHKTQGTGSPRHFQSEINKKRPLPLLCLLMKAKMAVLYRATQSLKLPHYNVCIIRSIQTLKYCITSKFMFFSALIFLM